MNYKKALFLINRKMAEIHYPHQPKTLYESINYILSMEGKKIRAILTLMACHLFQENIKPAINTALAWEIFHNFTLIHDDIMDNATLRRGNPTIHAKWNKTVALLSGDSMLILAYKYIAKSPKQYRDILLKLFSFTATKVCEGQMYDVLFENRSNILKKEYLNLIHLKTATLLSACLYSGAIIGNANKQDAKILKIFGVNLGIAFQIQDDVLDTYGNSSFGEKISNDIISNKKTYLLISALNSSNKIERDELLFWLNEKEQKEKKVTSIINLYNKMKIKEKADKTIKNYYNKALDCLNTINIKEEKKNILIDFTNQLKNRKF
ncbi:MAG: polyprenyl synthetase family protein [Bacteroidales bacterium OttesenSCG-928-I14]|jgi:geranylgeranyl diphosphate synthase type II|nr:polyprenyl synthetase family protein [Bacteroidales bacterium OttesenSCG-928-I14]